MRQSPLFSGILYLFLGLLFVFFAVQNINEDGGWGFFTILLVLMATFDLGAGIRMISLHFFIKSQSKK